MDIGNKNNIESINGHHVHTHQPWLFHVAQAGINRNIKGSWRLLAFLQKTILKNHVAAYTYEGTQSVTLFAPLFRPESCKEWTEFDRYDHMVAQSIKGILDQRKNQDPIWYVDAGADIGIVCAQILRHVEGIEKIFAFEPNDAARPYLEAMLSAVNIESHTFEHAVGEAEKTGFLSSPENDPSEHARFFQESPDGPIKMMAINSLPKPTDKTVILKIDVEGTETMVIEGADAFLGNSKDFVVSFEAHPQVLARTGQTPELVVNMLNKIKPCKLMLAEQPDITFTASAGIAEQIPGYENGVHNLICTTIF